MPDSSGRLRSIVQLRPATWEDVDFLYELLRASMREHVERIWYWDDQCQRERFEGSFNPAENRIIVLSGQDIGVIGTRREADEIFLARLYILPGYQNRGIGTHLLKVLLAQASREGLVVRLRVLRGNPAKRLYERLGFETEEVADTHVYLRALPNSY